MTNSTTVPADQSSPTARPITVSSPDGQIRFSLNTGNGLPEYSVVYRQTTIIDRSPLSLKFAGESEFGKGVRAAKPVYSKGIDDYLLVVGKTSHVHDTYNEIDIPLQQTQSPFHQIHLLVRVFNDGLAFRYIIPEQTGWTSMNLTAENTNFRFAQNPTVLASYRINYNSSHEGRYTRAPFSECYPDSLMDMPIFLQFPNQIYAAVTEAQLRDYAGMYLVKHGDRLRGELSPLPGEAPITGNIDLNDTISRTRVIASLPHRTPWRVILLGTRPGALIESNIITNLNDSTRISDLSWLKPGTSDFHWWNGDIVPDTTFPPGINFETNKYYIDFCARNHITYHSVIGYGGTAWYVNDGISYDAGPHADPTKPIPGLDMKEICDYAKSKGVGIRVWVHWKALYPVLEKAFAQFEEWGIAGMMVDFMDRDDQQMVNIQEEILQKAAAHHLHIQFHGAFKPTGLSRTYPNEFTREGTLNYENDKWGNPITPDDDLNVVFTRLLAGPTDYHLGGFHAVTPDKYQSRYTRPVVLGTRAHMLAMYVILESYLGMICDYPEAYEGQPGFDFLQSVPTTWDETKVPAAIPGSYATIARRKGADWYVGTINNHEEKSVQLSLQWLPPGEYTATIYSDSPDANIDPNHLTISRQICTPNDTITLKLAPGGGQVMRLQKTK